MRSTAPILGARIHGLLVADRVGSTRGRTARSLAELPPFALYQLTMHARDRGHPLAAEAMPILQRAGLAEPDGVITEAIRSMVLAHVSGHGLTMAVSSRGKQLVQALNEAPAGRTTGLGIGAGRSKLLLEDRWLDRVKKLAVEKRPGLVAGALVDMARVMASSGRKFDVREMAKWSAAAHTLTDENGRVTPPLQRTINRIQSDLSSTFSKKTKLLFQDTVAMAGGKLAGEHEMPLRRASYWLKGPQALANFQSTKELPKTADIVIIGAGITGASTAYHLAEEARRQGKTVVVIEKYDPAHGASGRNGGNFETLGEQFWGKYGSYDGVVAERFKFLKEAYPDQPDEVLLGQALHIAEVLTRFALKNAQRMLKTIDESGIDCDVSKTGWLRTAMNEREEKGLLAQAMLARRLGAKIRVMRPETIQRTYKIPAKFIGHVIYDNGNYHPGKLVTGELQKAIERGVKLYTRTSVEKIESDAVDRHRIKTDRGTIVAGRVIMATNAFTSEIFPELSDIKYKRSQVMTMEHVKNDLRGVTYTEEDGDIYVNQPKQDHTVDAKGQKRGTLLVGGGYDTLAKNPHSPRPQKKIYQSVAKHTARNHKETEGQPGSRLWGGPMAFVEGPRGMRMPVVGTLGDGAQAGVLLAVFCNGYGGGGCHNTGFNAAEWALTGKIPKELVQDVFSPARLFDPNPLWDIEAAARRGRAALDSETNFSAILAHYGRE